jgi:hypothetical protein
MKASKFKHLSRIAKRFFTSAFIVLLTNCGGGGSGNNSSDGNSNSGGSPSDITAPIISLVGDSSVNLDIGDSYIDLGATVADNVDTSVSAIVDSSSVTNTTAGTYFVTYNATDSAGNQAVEVIRTVTVLDLSPPIITLIGASTVNLNIGENYVDLGATVVDNADTSLLVNIDSSSVNPEKTGAYTVTFNTQDSAGNQAVELTRTVIVVAESSVTPMLISSIAFKDTGSTYINLPLTYTCDGVDGGRSPLLTWSGVSANVESFVIDMSDNEGNKYFTIDITNEGLSTYAVDDKVDTYSLPENAITNYIAPCGSADSAGEEFLFTFTLTAKMYDGSTSGAELTVRRVFWGANALAADLHVPPTAHSSCNEMMAHFNEYSALHEGIGCVEGGNLQVNSYINVGAKSKVFEQKPLVGATEWIGRIPLPKVSRMTVTSSPEFYSREFFENPERNMSCNTNPSIGVTTDGIKMLTTYRKYSGNGEDDTCGPFSEFENDYAVDMAVFGSIDACYGHAPNADGYHLHGPPICMMDTHDPSKPLAYMIDGIPLYFGQAGGSVETNENHVRGEIEDYSKTDYGRGLYTHLNYFPAAIKEGMKSLEDRMADFVAYSHSGAKNSLHEVYAEGHEGDKDHLLLNKCNAYDINGDGAISGYAYYTTKDVPYFVGCFMANKDKVKSDQNPTGVEASASWNFVRGYVESAGTISAASNTNSLGYELPNDCADNDFDCSSDRDGFPSQSVEKAINVEIMDTYQKDVYNNGKTYIYTELNVINATNHSGDEFLYPLYGIDATEPENQIADAAIFWRIMEFGEIFTYCLEDNCDMAAQGKREDDVDIIIQRKLSDGSNVGNLSAKTPSNVQCMEFSYRADIQKTDGSTDNWEVLCLDNVISDETLNLFPFL